MAGRFRVETTLRRGRFCVTARGRRLGAGENGNEFVFLKEITTEELKNADQLKKALNETKSLLKLSAPELVKILDIAKGDLVKKKWTFVTEFCQGGTLRQKMSEYQSKGVRFNEKQILEWFFSVATAINYLHNNQIIHGALNCQNILFEDASCSVVKAGDYGLSQFREICKVPPEPSEDPLAAWCYRAPEAFKGQLDYKSDIWSLGVLLFELAVFDLPYHGFNQTQMFEQMAKPPTRKIPISFSESYRNLAGEMLQFRMSNRPCAADVLFDDCLQDHVIGQFESMKLSLGGEETPTISSDSCTNNENEDLTSDLSEDDEELAPIIVESEVNNSSSPPSSAEKIEKVEFVSSALDACGQVKLMNKKVSAKLPRQHNANV